MQENREAKAQARSLISLIMFFIFRYLTAYKQPIWLSGIITSLE